MSKDGWRFDRRWELVLQLQLLLEFELERRDAVGAHRHLGDAAAAAAATRRRQPPIARRGTATPTSGPLSLRVSRWPSPPLRAAATAAAEPTLRGCGVLNVVVVVLNGVAPEGRAPPSAAILTRMRSSSARSWWRRSPSTTEYCSMSARRTSSATALASARHRDVSTTFAPAEASTTLKTRPRPRLPPVTMHVRPRREATRRSPHSWRSARYRQIC